MLITGYRASTRQSDRNTGTIPKLEKSPGHDFPLFLTKLGGNRSTPYFVRRSDCLTLCDEVTAVVMFIASPQLFIVC